MQTSSLIDTPWLCIHGFGGICTHWSSRGKARGGRDFFSLFAGGRRRRAPRLQDSKHSHPDGCRRDATQDRKKLFVEADYSARNSMVEALIKQDYQVLTLDLYGHGRSAFPADVPLSAEVYMEQITELLTVLGMMSSAARKTKLTMVGFSMGGFLAAKWTTLHPDRVGALVMHSPWTHHLPAAATWTLRRVGIIALLTGAIIKNTFDDCASPPRAIATYLCNLTKHGDWEGNLKQLSSMENLPILMICGKNEGPFLENTMHIYTRLADTCQSIDLALCPGANHMSWLYGTRHCQHFFQSKLVRFLEDNASLAHLEPPLINHGPRDRPIA